MVGKGLTESDMLEIVYKSDESFSDSGNDSVSSSDNETDDPAVADAVTYDDSDDDEEMSHQELMWETKDNYTGHREVFNCDSGPRLGTENVSDIVESLSYCVTKKSYNKLLEELIGMKNNTKKREAMFSPFCSFVRLRIPVMKKKFTLF